MSRGSHKDMGSRGNSPGVDLQENLQLTLSGSHKAGVAYVLHVSSYSASMSIPADVLALGVVSLFSFNLDGQRAVGQSSFTPDTTTGGRHQNHPCRGVLPTT